MNVYHVHVNLIKGKNKMSVANPIAEIAAALRAMPPITVANGTHTKPVSIGGPVTIPAVQPINYVERFITPKEKESYYIVKFEIDQRDADRITVSSKQSGKLDNDELIKLAIMLNYQQIDDWDGEWYNLGAMEEYLSENYLDGFFYDSCNRFGFDDITIEGYDADKDEFYSVVIPELEDLGITNITEAYHKYFKTGDDCDSYETDED